MINIDRGKNLETLAWLCLQFAKVRNIVHTNVFHVGIFETSDLQWLAIMEKLCDIITFCLRNDDGFFCTFLFHFYTLNSICSCALRS